MIRSGAEPAADDAGSLQKEYYRTTAAAYDRMHIGDQEHEFALAFMLSVIRHLDVKSILDVGSGTGRALLAVKSIYPTLKITGIEPSAELRAQAYAKGLSSTELMDGDALAIGLPTSAVDLVCSFGVLHHVKRPDLAISEMLRVGSRAVFISDNNDFGRGSPLRRAAKQVLHAARLWWPLEMLATKGKGYRVTSDDGLWYSFSIFDYIRVIEHSCAKVHMCNTDGTGPNLFRSAGHVAVLGIK